MDIAMEQQRMVMMSLPGGEEARLPHEGQDEAAAAAAIATGPPNSRDSLVKAALKVLRTGDPWLKASYGDVAASLWRDGLIARAYDSHELLPPKRPARSNAVRLVPSHSMPKLGKGGSLSSRQALLHSLVHIESWAVDLSWDIIARFGKEEAMPREFFDDFVKVAEDEARHFRLLAARLQALGSCYGALPAHDGLWDSAEATSKDLSARLVIEHCVHEARGLDVLPGTIARFRKGGDDGTADLLETVIYPEEVTHCAAGLKWFTYLCLRNRVPTEHGPFSKETESTEEVVETFHRIVRRHFKGPLKPPFNVAARDAAGFPKQWYLPLSIKN